jgi:hypothetical protein
MIGKIASKLAKNESFVAFLQAFGKVAEKVKREVAIHNTGDSIIIDANRLDIPGVLEAFKPLLKDKLEGKRRVLVVLPKDLKIGRTKDNKLILVFEL